MLTLTNLHKSLGTRPVLQGFNLRVEAGETVALLGLSGSGKTTVLKLISGLLLPDQGEIYFGDRKLEEASLRELRRQIGYVIQDGGLFPHLTLLENLELVGREAGLTETEILTRTQDLVTLTQLDHHILSRYPRQVSGGQRQRVGIMRALFLNPDYLLLDEPLGALDPITRRELQDELKTLFRRLSKSVVLVTHDLLEARYLADRIILLDAGKIAQQGSMADIIESPASDFVRKFVQSQSVRL